MTFYKQDRKDYASITDYDLRMCYWDARLEHFLARVLNYNIIYEEQAE